MPFPPLSDAHKDRIQQHILKGLTVPVIADIEGIGKSTIYRINKNLVTFGKHTAPAMSKRGRPSRIGYAARVGLRAFIESKPSACLDEMQSVLFDRFDLRVSVPTISNTLRAMQISRKRPRREASERSQLCRDTLQTSTALSKNRSALSGSKEGKKITHKQKKGR